MRAIFDQGTSSWADCFVGRLQIFGETLCRLPNDQQLEDDGRLKLVVSPKRGRLDIRYKPLNASGCLSNILKSRPILTHE